MTVKKFQLDNDLVQIPLQQLKEMLKSTFLRISIHENNIEIFEEDFEDDEPLSTETIMEARKCRKEYQQNPEHFSQIVK